MAATKIEIKNRWGAAITGTLVGVRDDCLERWKREGSER